MFENFETLHETVNRHNLWAEKSLGQNFLLDKNVLDKIINTSLQKQGRQSFDGCNVFEIGCGPGGLTRAILEKKPASLTIIEMDERCVNIAQELKEFSGISMDIIHGDAMKTKVEVSDKPHKHIVSNLPYNISVALLTGWLKNMSSFESLTLMFQKEVADRIVAKPNSKTYGKLSVLTQLIAEVEILFDLNPKCFVPAPKVWSSVLLFRPKNDMIFGEDVARLEQLTTAAFGQRRKMIRQSLKAYKNLQEVCEKTGVLPTHRPEQISPEQFLQMSRLLFF